MPTIINENARKLVPVGAAVYAPHIDERAAIVAKAKKQLGAKASGMHFFYGDKTVAETGRYADDGYVTTGLSHRGDPLFMRPDAMHERHLAEAAGTSNVLKRNARSGKSDEYKTRSDDGNIMRPQEENE